MSLFLKQCVKAALVMGFVPAWAGTTANFDFYANGGPAVDHLSSAPTYNEGLVGVTIRAFDPQGHLASVTERWDGIGADSGGLIELGDVSSSLFSNPGERLELTFNQQVKINSIGFSYWENGLFGPVDQASLKWGTNTLTLGNNNDGGLLVKDFNFSTTPTGTVFSLTATGSLSSFRLAGLNVTTVAAVPEAGTLALMTLGLMGVAFATRRRT